MKVRAPGKLLLTGAYSVLEGAPALVLAVNRYAVADSADDPAAAPEVLAALDRPPHVDTSQLREGAIKLGLGSSAAAVVAAVGLRAAEEGESLEARGVRDRLMRQAFDAHAKVQGGGSGVDIAASVYGGALLYVMNQSPKPVSLPSALVWQVFFSGQSARTSELRARVDALKARDKRGHAAIFAELSRSAKAGAESAERGDAGGLVGAAAAAFAGLSALGAAADAPIVTSEVAELARVAALEGAAFLPSGAGGGDSSVFVGTSVPSASFVECASRLSQMRIDLACDLRGVQVAP